VGEVNGPDGWKQLNAERIDLCLQPFTASTDNAIARGRRPLSNLLKPDVANALRAKQLDHIKSEVLNFYQNVVEQSLSALEDFATQVSGQIEIEVRNRELGLQRRRNSRPEGVPLELWQGQIAVLERSLEMARLNGTEAIRLVQEFGAGRLKFPQPEPISILVSLVSDQ
jgi:ATP-dependent helicase HepA